MPKSTQARNSVPLGWKLDFVGNPEMWAGELEIEGRLTDRRLLDI